MEMVSIILPRKLKNLAEEFRYGIASAIGVSPEDIRPDIVEKWVIGWTKALLTPEAFRRIWGHHSPSNVEVSTMELFKHILSIIRPVSEISEIKRKKRGL